jgi:serine protease Do
MKLYLYLLLSLSVAATTACDRTDERPPAVTAAQANAQDSVQDDIAETRRTAITEAVSNSEPAVVSINVMGTRTIDNPWFELFFGRRRSEMIEQKVEGVGSGFVISPDGYIVTNDHVVSIGNRGTPEITVAFPDGETRSAELVGTDQVTDIALLKVDPDRDLPCLSFGSSSDVLTGEWVIAMGNPFGLFEAAEPSVTVGVVSAKDRDFEARENRLYRDMLQTDAAINQGNSGGPLLNALGEVVGVNTFILSGRTNSGSIGLGFAVPSNKVQNIVAELREHGEVDRSFYTGLSVRQLTPQIARSLELSSLRGAVVARIENNSPAEEAGFEPYDVITHIGGEEVDTPQEASLMLTQYRPGDDVPIRVLRKGEQLELTMTLEEARE